MSTESDRISRAHRAGQEWAEASVREQIARLPVPPTPPGYITGDYEAGWNDAVLAIVKMLETP